MAEKKVRLDELQPYDLNGEKTRIVELYTVHNKSLSYIAQVIGKSPNYVSKVLHEAYQEDKHNRDLRILAHSQTIEWMMSQSMEKIRKIWDRKEVELWLKLRDTEARLKGLDQPVKAEVNVQIEHVSDDELIAQLEGMGIQVTLPTSTQPLPLPEHIEDAICEPVQAERCPESPAE